CVCSGARLLLCRFVFSSRRRHTRSKRDWSSDVCSSDLVAVPNGEPVWVSWSLLGSVHEATVARVWKIAEHIRAVGLLGPATKGKIGRASCRERGEMGRGGVISIENRGEAVRTSSRTSTR